jgi:hypothetical protein
MAITTTISLSERAASARAAANDLEAQAIALAHEEDAAVRALVERQRLPVAAASATAARAALAAVDRPKVELRPWPEVLADASVGLDGLFAAWLEHRASHAARAATVRTAGAHLDSSDPRTGDDGQPLPWRRDTEDRMAGTSFLREVEAAVEVRTQAAAGAAAQAVAQSCNDAGTAAAAKVK